MLLDFIVLDSTENLYLSLYEKLKSAIERGVIKKGEKLPSVREAAKMLGISRTTVENAYSKLCIEGYAESFPQKGYYIIENKPKENLKINTPIKNKNEILYDFSSRRIDKDNADIKVWKKTVRQILLNQEELTSYGDNQGEEVLRNALANYSYKARGVVCTPENIIVAAGIGPLLHILCALIGRDIKIGFSNDGFKKAENIFSDFGIKTLMLDSDKNGALQDSVLQENIDVLFLTPSSLPKLSIGTISKRRSDYAAWAEKEDRIIIEDDYNGELRFTARSLPAFQGKCPQKTVYIGSFSKLLLPSVRLAYMVLPDFLIEKFKNRYSDFNQTCGKIDQLSLAEYITSGNLEKQLRRLRRLYYSKSQILSKELKVNLTDCDFIIYESLLTVRVFTKLGLSSEEICKRLLDNGILAINTGIIDSFDICFSGIKAEEIAPAVAMIKKVLKI